MIQGWNEARRLGHHWVGEEHVLIALAGGGGAAGDVLREAGATVELLEALVTEGLLEADPPVDRHAVDSPTHTAAVYAAFGRAECFAVSRGANEPDPEDMLIALLWRARLATSCLDRLGIDRADVFRGLAERGVAVPSGEPEPLDRHARKRVDVPFDALMTIVRELPPRLPEGTAFGFNLHNETQRAWVLVGEGVDAEPLIAEILSGR